MVRNNYFIIISLSKISLSLLWLVVAAVVYFVAIIIASIVIIVLRYLIYDRSIFAIVLKQAFKWSFKKLDINRIHDNLSPFFFVIFL